MPLPTMPDTLELVAKDLLRNEDPTLRRIAVEALGNAGDPAALPALFEGLHDTNKGVRDAVAQAIVNIGTPAAAAGLAPLLGVETMTLRNLAAKLLIKLGRSSADALHSVLLSANKDTRKFAVDILGEIRSEASLNYLKLMLHDPDPNVVVSAIEAIGNIGKRYCVGDLCLTYESKEYARTSVVEAFRKIGDIQTAPFLLQWFRREFRQTPKHELLLILLAETLAVVGDKACLAVLLECAGQAEEQLRLTLLSAVVQLSERLQVFVSFSDDMRKDFLAALNETNVALVTSAVKGLFAFQEYEVTQALINCLGKDEDLDFLLFSHLPERSKFIQASVGILESGTMQNPLSLIVLLGRVIPPLAVQGKLNGSSIFADRAFDLIARHGFTADQETRTTVMDVLFKLNPQRAVTVVEEMVQVPDPWVKMHVVEILGSLRGVDIERCATLLASDEDEMVREAAMTLFAGEGSSTSDATGYID